MLKQKEIQLKDKLKNIIKEIGHMNDVKQEIGKIFKSKNLHSHRAINVFMNYEDLVTLTDSENDIRFLFLFVFALNQALKEKGLDDKIIKMDEYFTQVEISQWTNYNEESEPESIYPIIFENVDIISEGYWQTTLTSQQVEKLNAANVFIYNPNSQRELKVTKKGIRINVNPDKVNEIAERMLNGKQFPDDLKFNILRNGEEKIIYDAKKRTLTIYEGSIINTWDGQHRKEANAVALSKNANLRFTWPIKLTNKTEIETHEAMVQIDKQTKMSKEVLAQKDPSKNENLTVDKIMDLRGELWKVTMESGEYVKDNRGLVTKFILSQAIKDNYEGKIETSYDRSDTAEWINNFIDYLMAHYRDEFLIRPYEIKKNSYINNLYMFYGFIALSKKLQGNKDWKESLKQKINSIDFNKTNGLWRDIGLVGEKNINKTTKNKLYNLFIEE